MGEAMFIVNCSVNVNATAGTKDDTVRTSWLQAVGSNQD